MPGRALLVVVLLVIATVTGAWWAIRTFSPELTVEVTQQQLQAQLDPRFPAQKCLLTACFELQEPKVRLEGGADHIAFTARFVATLGRRTMPGTVAFTGKPRYDPGSASFYLDDVKVSEFQMSGNAPDFDEVVRVRGPGVMQALLRNVPIYRLDGDSKYGSLAKLALRSVQVVDGRLRIRFLNPLGWFG